MDLRVPRVWDLTVMVLIKLPVQPGVLLLMRVTMEELNTLQWTADPVVTGHIFIGAY